MMIILTANEYLDARRSDWRRAEREGEVTYDRLTRSVRITCPHIIAALAKR